MRKSTRLALAFMALAGAVGTTAYAENKGSSERMRDGVTTRLDKAMNDADNSITFDQFSSAIDLRLTKLAADNGGRLTVAELAEMLEKERLD